MSPEMGPKSFGTFEKQAPEVCCFPIANLMVLVCFRKSKYKYLLYVSYKKGAYTLASSGKFHDLKQD